MRHLRRPGGAPALRLAAVLLAAVLPGLAAAQGEPLEVRLAWLRLGVERPPVLSELDPIPADDGLMGARLGVEDNATTGRFLGHAYQLEETDLPPGGDLPAAARAALAGGAGLLLVDAPPDALLAVADLPEAEGALILNVAAEDDRLRGADCRANVIHAAPSLAMRADALMQFLVLRRWDEVALVTGSWEGDAPWGAALRASAGKFGLDVVDDVAWSFDGDLGRTAQQEIPLLTQDLARHDVLVVADGLGDWSRYVPYNTWEPRPVAGSEGLTPVAWSPVLENWGASQLQSRFQDLAGRPMRPRDYAAWVAVRAVGEAVTRGGSAEPADVRARLLDPAFQLDGFKGRALSVRDWDGQVRMPIAVVQPRALVGMAPFEPFLHEHDELDTLGTDRPESLCTAFGAP